MVIAFDKGSMHCFGEIVSNGHVVAIGAAVAVETLYQAIGTKGDACEMRPKGWMSGDIDQSLHALVGEQETPTREVFAGEGFSGDLMH
jgi:hypothetical protein